MNYSGSFSHLFFRKIAMAGLMGLCFGFVVTHIPVIDAQVAVSEMKVYATGPDVSVSTVPAGVFTRLDALAQTIQNPATYTNLSVGMHTVYTTRIPGYTVEVASCEYNIGAPECTVSNFNPITCDVSLGLCPTQVFTSGNRTQKVVFRYTNENFGTVVVKRVGNDLQTTSIAQTYAWTDAAPATTTNPATFTNVPRTNNYFIYATYLPNYYVRYGECHYLPGEPSCTVTNFGSEISTTTNFSGSEGCDPILNICRKELTGFQNYIKRVVLKYSLVRNSFTGETGGSTVDEADLKITRTGPDQNPLTAPAGVVSVDNATSSSNPSAFFNLPIVSGVNKKILVTNVPGFTIEYGDCAIARGYTDCVPSTPNQLTTCNAAFCTLDYPMGFVNHTYSLRFRYVPLTNVTNDILVTRTGYDQTTLTAPPNTTSQVVSDTGVASSIQTFNPALFSNLPRITYPTKYKVRASHSVLYSSIKVGMCSYQRGTLPCNVTGYNDATCTIGGWCESEIDTNDEGYVYKVDFRYSTSSTPLPPTGGTVGDVLIKRVGADLYAASAPAGQTVSFNTLPAKSENPARYLNVSSLISQNTAYTSYNPAYQITYGTCLYARGDTECVVPDSSLNQPAFCDIIRV
jgi:hypothetical protein